MVPAARVFPVASSNAHGFHWMWRSADGSRESRSAFLYFFDCLEDARAAGYSVEEVGSSGTNANKARLDALR